MLFGRTYSDLRGPIAVYEFLKDIPQEEKGSLYIKEGLCQERTVTQIINKYIHKLKKENNEFKSE